MMLMASYDSAGHRDPLPGLPDFQSHDSGLSAPGASPQAFPDASATPERGTVADSAFVVPAGASTANGDRVTVGPLDTLSGPQADLYAGADANPLSGLPGDWVGHSGAGRGRVGGPGNPNAVSVPSLATQAENARRHS
jgi:hypothetical protein